MAVELTYRKREDGKVLVRHVETREDVNGQTFTVADIEKEFNHERHIPQFTKQLEDVRSEIALLEKEETRLVNEITAIKNARDGR